ncbi:response regulator [Psychroflexus montanilacus]|uniref:response regulator n=1 Tax=Psychroflexus montanilacus TaxID=2873598 RepID=UPI001CCB852E|nr:response regulator transcription factor [Psychroflexus montanilacus]MBZ9650840.1 response regulator transcription factor [Psychroflexus montanilacus]
MKKINKIILADDHDVVKHGVEAILRQNILNPEIIKVSSTNELRNQLLAHKNVDLVILDIKMPGGNTVDIVKDIKANYVETKILMYSAHEEPQYAVNFIRNGADGYLSKSQPLQKIALAIKVLENDKRFIDENIDDGFFDNKSDKDLSLSNILSHREFQILSLLAEGKTNIDISDELNLQKSTVSTYKKRIMQKLNINNNIGLVDAYRTDYKISAS